MCVKKSFGCERVTLTSGKEEEIIIIQRNGNNLRMQKIALLMSEIMKWKKKEGVRNVKERFREIQIKREEIRKIMFPRWS